MTALTVTELVIEYERADGSKVLAVDNVSLDIDEGQFVCIVGPSGCGKTTLLKSVNGLITPTSGEIMIQDRPLEQKSRDRAMVFQEASLFPWYSIVRNIGYGLECRGMSKKAAAAQVAPFISMVGLKGFEKHYPYEISGGMQQRANLARALVVEPKILLMDEPFAALDAQTREMMQAELLDVWQQTRKTVLFITHQINEAIYLADRVVVMSARPGRLLADISIDLPRPRGLDLKRTRAFLDYEDQIWQLIESQARLTMASDQTTSTSS